MEPIWINLLAYLRVLFLALNRQLNEESALRRGAKARPAHIVDHYLARVILAPPLPRAASSFRCPPIQLHLHDLPLDVHLTGAWPQMPLPQHSMLMPTLEGTALRESEFHWALVLPRLARLPPGPRVSCRCERYYCDRPNSCVSCAKWGGCGCAECSRAALLHMFVLRLFLLHLRGILLDLLVSPTSVLLPSTRSAHWRV